MSNIYTSINQRVVEFILEQIKAGKLSRSEIIEEFGVDKGQLSRILNGKLPVPKSLVEKIDNKFGDVFESIIHGAVKNKGVPYYDVDVTATAEMFLGQERETTDTYIMIPGFEDCTGWVNVYGKPRLIKYFFLIKVLTY